MRLILSLGIILLFNIACETSSNVVQSSPEEAIKGLFSALKSNDFEKAKQYCTTSTKESLTNFVTNLNMVGNDEKNELLTVYNFEISKVNCAEKAGTMICKLCCSGESQADIEMIQQDNKWFAQLEFVF